MNRVFIGFDPRQPVSYNVLQQSIAIRSSEPVAITPLIIEQLPIKRRGLTPFTFTRFLVPWLCDYKGYGLFLDSDMIVLDDITKLFNMAEPENAVSVVKCEAQFEWASLMLFNCEHPDNAKLDPFFIDETPDALHKICWTDKIGELPPEWNHIVFYDEPREDAKLVHYTAGIPGFPEVQGCEYTDEWHKDAQFMISTKPWQELMGNSVHVEKVRKFQQGKALRDSVQRGS